MTWGGDLRNYGKTAPIDEAVMNGERARDYLLALMGARLADNLLAQLYSAGFKIVPIERPIPGLRPE